MNWKSLLVDAAFCSRRRSGARTSAVGLAIVLACGAAHGQVGAASLSGIVQDKTGAVIPNATVTVQNNASGAQRVSKSKRPPSLPSAFPRRATC